jgi:hypothetical protein
VEAELKDGPYLDENITGTTLRCSGTSGSVTLTASSATGINDGQGFLASDVGRHVRIKAGSRWGWGRITARASATQATLSLERGIENTNATKNWRLGAFSNTTGWPVTAAFFQERLCLFLNNMRYLSSTGDFTLWEPTGDNDGTIDVLAHNGITSGIYSSQDRIVWAEEGAEVLLTGTEGGIFALRGTAGDPLKPDNTESFRVGPVRSAAMQPARAGASVLSVNAARRKVFQTAYDFSSDAPVPDDLSQLAEDVTVSGIEEIAFGHDPDPIMYARLGDGKIAVMSYDTRNQFIAWAKFDLGGVVESLTVMPGAERDTLSLIVRRDINGVTRRFKEIQQPQFVPATGDDRAGAWYLDCAAEYQGETTDAISGLDYLEGETLVVYANNDADANGYARLADVVVSAGAVTLEHPVSHAVIGLPIVTRIKTLPVEIRTISNLSNPAGPKSITRAYLRLMHSLGGRVTATNGDETTLFQFDMDDDFDAAPEWITGEQEVLLSGGVAETAQMTIDHADPYPFTLLSVTPQVASGSN